MSSVREVLEKYYPLLVVEVLSYLCLIDHQEIFTYYSSVYSGDLAVGLGGMAYNEIILQYNILNPIIDSGQTFSFQKENQQISQQPIPKPGDSFDIRHRVPSTRATMLLNQIHNRAKTPPAFLLNHGLDAIDSTFEIENLDKEGEDDDVIMIDEVLENEQLTEEVEYQNPEIGAIQRVEVDMVFISNCTSG
jgi:hypothetical protein